MYTTITGGPQSSNSALVPMDVGDAKPEVVSAQRSEPLSLPSDEEQCRLLELNEPPESVLNVQLFPR